MTVISRVVRVIGEGIAWAGAGVGLLYLTLPDGFLHRTPPPQTGLLGNAFARRWDGTCTGWTRELAGFHVANDILLWIAYVTVALVMWRLHPIIRRAPSHKITLHFICFIFLTCGATHLFSAYVVFNPIYVFDGAFKLVAGLIGGVGAVLVARDLVTVFDQIRDEHRRLDALEAKLEGRRVGPERVDPRPGPGQRTRAAILEGLALATVLGLLLWIPDRTPVTEGSFRNDFASQWTGACTGWTRPLAVLYMVGSLVTWAAYVLMGWVVLRLHPISRRVRAARYMVPAVSAVLASCGSIHLVEAYAILNPIFVALAWQKLVVAGVSLLGAVLVSFTLVAAFDATTRERRRLQQLEVELSGS